MIVLKQPLLVSGALLCISSFSWYSGKSAWPFTIQLFWGVLSSYRIGSSKIELKPWLLAPLCGEVIRGKTSKALSPMV